MKVTSGYFWFYGTEKEWMEDLREVELGNGIVVYVTALFDFDSGAGLRCLQMHFINEDGQVINLSDYSYTDQAYAMQVANNMVKEHLKDPYYYRDAEGEFLRNEEVSAANYVKCPSDFYHEWRDRRLTGE